MTSLNIVFQEYEIDEDRIRIKQLCCQIIEYLTDYKMTLRETAENLDEPLSTIDRYIHTAIRMNYPTEYQRIVKILDWNKIHKFKPKKYWKEICPY